MGDPGEEDSNMKKEKKCAKLLLDKNSRI